MNLRTRIGLAFAGVLVVATGLIGWGVSASATSAGLARVDERLHALAERPGLARIGAVKGAAWDGVPIIEVARADDGTWQPRISALRTVLPPLPVLPPPGTEAFDALRAEPDTLVGAQGENWRAFATTSGRGEPLVLMALLTELDRAAATLVVSVVVIGGLVVVCGAALAWWVVGRAMRPVDRMVDTAVAVAGGDLTRRVDRPDDPTELGRLGRALDHMVERLAADAADRAATTELLRRFVADASHELRTPVTVIRGYAELFEAGGARNPRTLERAMGRIASESERLSRLVGDLVLLTRLDRRTDTHTERVDLTAVVDDAVADAVVLAAGRSVSRHGRTDPLEVVGDPVRLRQVVDNLLTNALTHTPAGTPVRVGLGHRTGTAVLTVADAGPGVPAEERERVFERFHRLDRSRSRAHGGSGLGLAISKAIVDSHGGTVAVRDSDLGGAEFVVTLPVAAGAAAGGGGGATAGRAAGGAAGAAAARRSAGAGAGGGSADSAAAAGGSHEAPT